MKHLDVSCFLLLAVGLSVSACGSSAAPALSTNGGELKVGETCRAKSDCGEGLECVFTTPGCTDPRGSCTRVPTLSMDGHHFFPACKSLPGGAPRCMCDGNESATACPAFVPFVNEGVCADKWNRPPDR